MLTDASSRAILSPLAEGVMDQYQRLIIQKCVFSGGHVRHVVDACAQLGLKRGRSQAH